jgi:hypothetical protein
MTANEKAGQHTVNNLVVPDDHASDLLFHLLISAAKFLCTLFERFDGRH